MQRRVCNRSAVVDCEDVRVSPHSRLRRQCGVIEVVTAPRLISPIGECASIHDAYRRGPVGEEASKALNHA